MIVSFPHMGTMHVPLSLMFSKLGADVLLPPPITKKTLELGAKYSPETVCLPFKLMLGNFIEALSAGADTLVTCGGIGPCRLGYYAEVQKKILDKLGYSYTMIVLEPNLLSPLQAVHRLFRGKNWFSVYQAVGFTWQMIKCLDRLENKVCHLRPYAVNSGELERLWQELQTYLAESDSPKELLRREKVAMHGFDTVELEAGRMPLRLGLTGEIYAMLEPFVNHHLVRRLGEMGAEVYPSLSLSEYVQVHLLKKQPFYREYQHSLKLAAPFLDGNIGGHGRFGVGQAIQMALNGFDGVIQVLPFTCMPEIIAKNILPQISKTYDIPVLSLTFDEQSGEAGVITRLEAFLDLLRYRHAKRKVDDVHAGSSIARDEQ